MFRTEEKLKNRIQELAWRRYFGHQTIAPFVSMADDADPDESKMSIPENISGGSFDLNDFFVGRDKYLWLDKTVTLLPKREDSLVVGLFNFGQTGNGGNFGFESMLYVDGACYQGVDTNHNEVIFDGLDGKEVRLTFMLWTGLQGLGPMKPFYHQCKQADMAYLHKNADALYYTGRAIVETLEYLDKNSEHYADIVTALDRAFFHVHWESPDFYESIDKALAVLNDELARLEKDTAVTVNVVGHTHIDVAWMWRLKHTREKAQRSFSTVLHLMDRDDSYIFQQGQPQLYQYMKDNCPEVYSRMKKRIAQGRWEPDGGMWVEADCNISSGESLVRQILHGSRFFEKEFGKKCTYLWLPDVFGYSWALPQILRQCELDTFMTTKISWNEYNTVPNDLFYWRGIDGTKILTYFVDVPEVGFQFENRYSTYNGYVNPRTAFGSWQKFKDKSLSKDILISYGFGDGGGGPTREMLELAKAMEKLPGLPHIKQTTAGDFFKKMHANVENTDRYVHTWDGELYLENHRGTYTTQGYNKKMNRYMENYLAQTEWLAATAMAQGNSYPEKPLHDAWEKVLLHQFHDIIPGSSIHEVYEDSHIYYDAALEETTYAHKQALDAMVQPKENSYSIYSSNSFAGLELVNIPEKASGCFFDEQGNLLPAQRTEDGYAVQVQANAFGISRIRFAEGSAAAAECPFILEGDTLQTPLYTISWNHQGQLTEIYDKSAKRQVLEEGQLGNVLQISEDKPLCYDAWNIEIFAQDKKEYPTLSAAPVLKYCGPLKAVVEFRYCYGKSTFRQEVTVYRDNKRIDFKTYADWHEDHKLLKVNFSTAIRTTKATYDIQYGHVERPTHWNNSWDWARFEVCGHKWMDLSEEGYGVSLLNDCKYGYSVKDNRMQLSLLKSPKSPDPEADMGEHEFTYALYPHTGSVTTGGTIEEANRLNVPAKVICGEFGDSRQLVRLSTTQVQLDAVKKAEDEDCIIVRLHECRGGRGEVTLSSDYPVERIVPCNLLEHDCGEAISGAEASFAVHPFEIKTFKLYLSKA